MSRKVLAASTLKSIVGLPLADTLPKFLTQLWKQWDVPALVVVSLTLQVILVFLSNFRRRSWNRFLTACLWSAYMASDTVATLALSVISSNLNDALKTPSPLDPRLELATFWAPFLLLHLGGPDTITAFALEDNELWSRHLLGLGVQTCLALYILFRAWTMSTLSALSILMLTAGSIKYAERTWSVWSASYDKRRENAEQALRKAYNKPVEDMAGNVGRYVKIDGRNVKIDLKDEIVCVVVATKVFPDTERMFANALVKHDAELKRIVEESSSSEVMKLIEMELQMMYENLYTKARVTLSSTGLALRFVSFLVTCTTLSLFSSLERRQRYFHSRTEYSLTILLLAVSVSLELYAAFIYLTSYRMISWFSENGMRCVARSMMKLAKLRTPNWSNSMGQFSDIRLFLQEKPNQLSSRIVLTRNKFAPYVYHRRVSDELKRFIHEYLKKQNKRRESTEQRFSFLKNRGKDAWNLYEEHILKQLEDAELRHQLEDASLVFEKEFGEIIILLHLVTEVCYLLDRPLLDNKVPDGKYKDVLNVNDVPEEHEDFISQMYRVSNHLSRYLMHLFVLSSHLLPQQAPVNKMFYEKYSSSWKPFFYENRDLKEEVYLKFWQNEYEFFGSSMEFFSLQVARRLLAAMRPNDSSPEQLKARWELLSSVWVELLVFAADQCKANAHAQHLRLGGELLTHVWVLLRHFGFIDEELLSLGNTIDRARFLGPDNDTDRAQFGWEQLV